MITPLTSMVIHQLSTIFVPNTFSQLEKQIHRVNIDSIYLTLLNVQFDHISLFKSGSGIDTYEDQCSPGSLLIPARLIDHNDGKKDFICYDQDSGKYTFNILVEG